MLHLNFWTLELTSNEQRKFHNFIYNWCKASIKIVISEITIKIYRTNWHVCMNIRSVPGVLTVNKYI